MTSKTAGETLRTIWRSLSRPLFGTQPRSQWVYVEGRASWKTRVTLALLVGLVGCGVAMVARIWLPAAFIENLCVEDGFGKSRSLTFLILFLSLSVLLGVGVSVWAGVMDYRMWRDHRNVPVGKRPLFRVRLIEGKAAARLGLFGMAWCGLIAVCSLAFLYLIVQTGNRLWLPVSVIEICQASQ